jgi:hypothetical protein
LEKLIKRNGVHRKKFIHLHMEDLIDKDDLGIGLQTRNEQKKILKKDIKAALTANDGAGIPKSDIKKTIKNLATEI